MLEDAGSGRRQERAEIHTIIAVADVWDELVSGIGDTPVAPAHALEIMSVDRLVQFDPLVVGALTMFQLTANATQ